jgi:hypothetical protein
VLIRPVPPARRTPQWGLFGASRQFLELDFSHLVEKGAAYAPHPSSRSRPIDAPIPRRTSKLTERSERGSSEAPLGHTLGHTPIGQRLVFVRRQKALLGGGETFYGLPARTDPKKV